MRVGKRVAVLSGLAAVMALASPRVMAQAPPGPITLPDSAQPHADPAPPPKAPKPAREVKPTIFGDWRFNRDESDDARERLRAAQQSNSQQRSSGPRVGVGGGGVGWPGGGGGGGYPGGGGGGGGYGRHGGSDNYSDADMALMADMVNPSYSLSVVPKQNEVDLSDEQDRKRSIYTDGRKIQKSTSDAARDVIGKWDGDRLVATEDGPHKGTIERVLTPAGGGEQLYETFRMLDSKGNVTVTVRYVFDRVEK